MKDSFGKTLIFACLLGIICAALLAACNVMTKERIADNKIAEKLRNVLEVFDVQFDKSASAKELLALRDEIGIKKRTTDSGLVLYEYDREGTRLLAVEFEGPGRNALIKGVLVFNAKTKVIFGISFYDQDETPGIGAKIVSDSFRNQFKGKSLTQGKRDFVPSGQGGGDHEIESISGATSTCDSVSAMLNKVIEKVMLEVDDVR